MLRFFGGAVIPAEMSPTFYTKYISECFLLELMCCVRNCEKELAFWTSELLVFALLSVMTVYQEPHSVWTVPLARLDSSCHNSPWKHLFNIVPLSYVKSSGTVHLSNTTVAKLIKYKDCKFEMNVMALGTKYSVYSNKSRYRIGGFQGGQASYSGLLSYDTELWSGRSVPVFRINILIFLFLWRNSPLSGLGLPIGFRNLFRHTR
jgi:hypothetical protein